MRIRMANGMVIQGHSRGEARLLYDEIFNKQVYLQNGIELHEGDVVMDVGANIGLFSLFVGQTLRDVTIHAFEPIPDIFRSLQRNTASLGRKIVLKNVGLSNQENEVVFTYYPRLPCFSTSCPDRLERRWADLKDILMGMSEKTGGRRGPLQGLRDRVRSWGVGGLLYYASQKKDRLCRLTRVSQILADERIDRVDLLKIDVEGAEWDVLRGIDVADWPKIQQLVVEVHDVVDGADGIAAWLEVRGYDIAIDRSNEGRRSPISMLYARRWRQDASLERKSRVYVKPEDSVAV